MTSFDSNAEQQNCYSQLAGTFGGDEKALQEFLRLMRRTKTPEPEITLLDDLLNTGWIATDEDWAPGAFDSSAAEAFGPPDKLVNDEDYCGILRYLTAIGVGTALCPPHS